MNLVALLGAEMGLFGFGVATGDGSWMLPAVLAPLMLISVGLLIRRQWAFVQACRVIGAHAAHLSELRRQLVRDAHHAPIEERWAYERQRFMRETIEPACAYLSRADLPALDWQIERVACRGFIQDRQAADSRAPLPQ